MTNNQITRQLSIKAFIISSLMIIAGMAILFIKFPFSGVIGSIILILGLCLLFLTGKETIYIPSGMKVKKNVFYYDNSECTRINAMLLYKDFDSIKKLEYKDHGMRLELASTINRDYAAVQLYQYVPHTYVESSPLYEFNGEEAEKLCSALAKK